MHAIKRIKNQFGLYDLLKDYDTEFLPENFDLNPNEWFIFDPNLILLPENTNNYYYKSVLDRKIIILSQNELANKNLSDFQIIDLFWSILYFDYKQARLDMKIKLVALGGFDNLSTEEKTICSKWFIVTKTQRDTIHNLLEQIKFGEVFHDLSKKSRESRLDIVLMYFYNVFDNTQINSILSNISTLATNYINFGIEGTLEGNCEGLFDFIEARDGTSFSSSGIKSMDIPNINIYVNFVMDILKNGLY